MDTLLAVMDTLLPARGGPQQRTLTRPWRHRRSAPAAPAGSRASTASHPDRGTAGWLVLTTADGARAALDDAFTRTSRWQGDAG